MLKTRVVSAIFLLAVFVLILWVGKLLLIPFLLLVLWLATNETLVLYKSALKISVLIAQCTLFVTLLLINIPIQTIAWFATFTWFALIASQIIFLISVPRLIALSAYLLLLQSALIIAFDLFEVSIVALLLVLLIPICADVGAYFAGKKWGRKKLAPSISPGKTWAGALGGFFSVCLFLMILGGLESFIPLPFVLSLNTSGELLHWLVVAFVLTLLAIFGDLYESLLKRQAGVKDSGTIIPGHGGVLDRIDAWLPVLAAAPLLLY